MASAERQSCPRRDRQIHNRRSAVVNFRRFAADLRSTAIWWRRARFSSSRAARDWKIERTDARNAVRKMGMSEGYEGCVPPSAQIFRYFDIFERHKLKEWRGRRDSNSRPLP